MQVHTWRGKGLWTEDRPPDPIPQTLQFRFSKTIGRQFWMNICPSCSQPQGDFFLYHEPDGAFWGHHDEDLSWAEEIRANGLPTPVGWKRKDLDWRFGSVAPRPQVKHDLDVDDVQEEAE
jgi:hypothetical protein